MGSAFVRVFSVLVLVLILLAGLALGGIALSDRIREMAHWDQQLSRIAAVMLNREAVLTLPVSLLEPLPVSVPNRRVAVADLPGSLQTRLDSASMLADRQASCWLLYLRLSPTEAIEFELGDRADQMIDRVSVLLQWRLDQYRLEQHRSDPESVSGLKTARIDQYLQTLSDSFSLKYLKQPPESLVPTIRLPSGQFVTLGQPQDWLVPTSWWSIFLAIVYALVCLGLVVYRLVSLVENRLNVLEQTTRRLAQGHLSARVIVRGHDPISRLGDSFNRTAEHIRRLLDIQREMVRAVSHELRTPISRMTFALDNLADMTTDKPVVQRSIKNMDGDLQELEQLVDEILTYARLEEGGPLLEFERTSPEAIARQVVSEACPPESIQVAFDDRIHQLALMAEVEPRYLHRAVQNLVGNACRYARSRVIVSCQLTDETCRIDVEDDGPGVPEEDWGKVFMAFARLDDSRTRKSGGFGLGLSIVRRIAYWHGGRAIVGRSERLSGAQFSLIWPRYQKD